MEEREAKKKVNKVLKIKRYLTIAGIVAGVILFVVFLCYLFMDKTPKVKTDAKSSLSKILEISDLSTVEYIYNSTVTVRDTEKYEVKYYVAYEGTVTMGIDFSKINIREKEGGEKGCIITVPKAEVQSVSVNIDSLDFIFPKEKYNTETVVQEAYGKCVKDLEVKAKMNNSLKESASEETEDAIRAILSPLVESEEGYQIDFYEEGEV